MSGQLNALSVDVEDYFHVAALSKVIRKEDWDTLPMRVVDNCRRIVDLFDEHRVRATFFVLGWVARKVPHLVRELHERGHEIACHGLSHSLIYTQSPDEFRRETREAKDILEDIVGGPVDGYRAASYSITTASRWALDILIESGFSYDSSIFPVRHDLYGMPGAARQPHRLVTSSGAEIVEFPPSVVRLFGQNVPVGGGGYFRLYPYGVTRALLRRINRDSHRPVMFYLHPWEVDPEQPRFEADWFSRFRHYTNLDKCEPRLRCLLRDFRFGSVSDVLTSLNFLGK